MPIQIVRNDITRMEVDAIVNAAKPSLLGGGGVDGAIHRAAGPELLEECRTKGGCRTGEAKITRGYRLPCRYVIHTVGPVWNGGHDGEPELLASCYRSSLALAREYGCRSVAFPLISAGIYGYPKDRALRVASDTIAEYLASNDMGDDMTVYIVVYSRESVQLGREISAELREYIDDRYVLSHPTGREGREDYIGAMYSAQTEANEPIGILEDSSEALPGAMEPHPRIESAAPAARPKPKARWQRTESKGAPAPDGAAFPDFSRMLDESFSQMVLRKIDEKGMTDAQCYKAANMDRKHFSKIRSDVHYQPGKKTAVALAIALRLDMSETTELLRKAGFALSESNLFDLIVCYFISRRKYNIFEINEVLFYYDQVTLG